MSSNSLGIDSHGVARKIAVCIATFQRSESTQACLRDLNNAKCQEEEIRIFATDGGSTDNTIGLLSNFPSVDLHIQKDAYWNRAMRNSINRALKSDCKYILLLNDDTFLKSNSICKLIEIVEDDENTIAVGETLDPDLQTISYGRLARVSRLSKIKFGLIDIGNPTAAITFNGNCVLMHTSLMSRLDNLDSFFSHSFGDIDLGLRASALGIKIKSPEFAVGHCKNNPKVFGDTSRFSLKSIRFALGDPKGLPIKEYIYFCKRHCGPFWFLNVASRYIKLLVGAERI